MKKILVISILFFGFSLATFAQDDQDESGSSGAEDQTTEVQEPTFEMRKREILTKCKKLMRPHRYSFTKPIRIQFKDFEYTKRLFIPTNFNSSYKFIINTDLMEQNATIRLLNGNPDDPKVPFEVLFEVTQTGQSAVFETTPDKPIDELYIEFIIPPTKGEVAKTVTGYVFLLSGYKLPTPNDPQAEPAKGKKK
jgi:hypothetical protein